MALRVTLLAALCLVVAATVASGAADDETEDQARWDYESAFLPQLTGRERVQILEDVVEQYGDTRWADDALWVLSEMADRGGYLKKAIEFRKQLLERKSPPELEPFTRSQRVYIDSVAPAVEMLLQYTGHLYSRKGEKVIVFNPIPNTGNLYSRKGEKVIVFNPIPMLTAEELAFDYQRTGENKLALEQYRKALSAAPPDSFFTKIYTRRIDQLEKQAELIKKAEQKTENTQPAGKAEEVEQKTENTESAGKAEEAKTDNGKQEEKTGEKAGKQDGEADSREDEEEGGE